MTTPFDLPPESSLESDQVPGQGTKVDPRPKTHYRCTRTSDLARALSDLIEAGVNPAQIQIVLHCRPRRRRRRRRCRPRRRCRSRR